MTTPASRGGVDNLTISASGTDFQAGNRRETRSFSLENPATERPPPPLLIIDVIKALALDWRKPLVASMLTAALLGLGLRSRYQLGHRLTGIVGWLSRISYSVFLIHYPIVLIVGTIITRLWPGNVSMAVIGFVTAWLMTWGLANVLYDRVEVARSRIRTDSRSG